MEIYVYISSISIVSLFVFISLRFYHIHWFYLYRSFKHSNCRRHEL